MAREEVALAATTPGDPLDLPPLIRSGLDTLDFGFAILDRDLKLVASNRAFRTLRGYPGALCRPGTPLAEFYRFNARRGDYGPGDVEGQVRERIERVRQRRAHEVEYTLPSGTTLSVRYTPIPHGLVLAYADITARRRAEEKAARKEAELQVALENMPGALAYTDEELNIVVCNHRFAEMYPVPEELLRPGRPYAGVFRYFAEHGYYGEGDVATHVASRVESLRDPSGRTFEDRTPDGRIYRVARRRASTGGTVTVITDVTELKEAEARLREAVQRAEAAGATVTEQNRRLESLSAKLSRYLSPQIYRSLFSGEKTAEVAAQRKKLTIFFSDIAGFTETTELLESEELTALLNQYLREMSSIALEYGATIDKFIGDAIMLFFGDPETRGAREDAIACVKMAIAMQQRMRDLQAEWRERGQQHVFQLRIGINTGYCTVGNFGSDERVDYTIIGNEVNLASRLQTHADLGGILLAHETWSLVKDAVLAEETGTITVKGFPRPVTTYRVVGLRDDSGAGGRVIRQEQEGLLLIVDQKKLTGQARADAIRILQEAASRLSE
jgi:class 3 adenylate cyclase/PAS domain-containing protein